MMQKVRRHTILFISYSDCL